MIGVPATQAARPKVLMATGNAGAQGGIARQHVPQASDYNAVISQIKREVLIHISRHSTGYSHREWGWMDMDPPGGGYNSYEPDQPEVGLLSDEDLEGLLTLAMREARQRGLWRYNRALGGGGTGMGLTQTLLAALLLPSVRQHLERVLCQTAVDGLDLVKQAGTLLERAAFNIALILTGGPDPS